MRRKRFFIGNARDFWDVVEGIESFNELVDKMYNLKKIIVGLESEELKGKLLDEMKKLEEEMIQVVDGERVVGIGYKNKWCVDFGRIVKLVGEKFNRYFKIGGEDMGKLYSEYLRIKRVARKLGYKINPEIIKFWNEHEDFFGCEVIEKLTTTLLEELVHATTCSFHTEIWDKIFYDVFEYCKRNSPPRYIKLDS